MKKENKGRNSLGVNAILNGMKSVASAFFPLITFPYVSRVLSVDGLGKYNFANSFVSYFVLIAGLGITSYAVREGAGIRSDKEKMSAFASEIFSINIFSSVISYLLLFASMFFWRNIEIYKDLILIFSVSIFFNTIGTEWILTIYEDFVYITKRSIAFQFLALVLLFLLVKNKSDYYIYACITVLSVSGANLLNILRVRNYCKVRFVTTINWKKHMGPILILFANSLATTIFVNSDVIILGLMESDYCVGIYSLSVKIYTIIKNFLSAVLIVSIPRLASYVGEGATKKYSDTLARILDTIIVLALPAMVGLFALSKQIVVLLGGEAYLDSIISLRILSVALIICLFGWMSNSCILIIHKREKTVLFITACSAIINVVLNFILIPLWKYNAAAFTTLVSEFVSMTLSLFFSREYYRFRLNSRNVLSVIIGCIGIVLSCILGNILFSNYICNILFSIIVSVCVYSFSLFLLRNSILMNYIYVFKMRIKGRENK